MRCLLTLLVAATPAGAQQAPRIGDTYEITRVSDTETRFLEGSSSSHDEDVLIERVLNVRDDGLELTYDLPRDATPGERASTWQFPARVFRPFRGPMRLLNRAELAARIDPWLRAGGLTRAACGTLIFTWNAFRINCDPDSVIESLVLFDVAQGDLHEGAPFRDPERERPDR